MPQIAKILSCLFMCLLYPKFPRYPIIAIENNYCPDSKNKSKKP